VRVLYELDLDLAMYGFAAAKYTDTANCFKIERATQDYILDARDVGFIY
jgi:hypothetical protein